MGTMKKISKLVFLCFPIVALLLPCNCNGSNEIKGMFVFGSSLVDNGNNNFLRNSRAKANYLPYGIDFPYGPSGRFTNGKNVIDLLCDKLSLPFVPPFGDPSTKGNRIIHGVNYASGASGILDDTGLLAGEVISLNEQLKNFEEVTLPELKAEVGKRSGEVLKKYLFVVGSGGNDYTLNYFLNLSDANVSLQFFTANLTKSLSTQLQKLYKLGGRKFVLMSLNPLGCYPVAKANYPSQIGCNKPLNRAAHLFNAQLKSLVGSIKPLMPASHLVYVNSYTIITHLITNPTSKGFKDASNPCCEMASINGLCKKDGETCEDRSRHVFFDGVHPTEAVNVLIANKAFDSNLKTEAYPINIKQLAMRY
ncbi:GDSL esterase/lipase At4g16230-like [Mercurialis annua]|uniref:GDSL esterase/lipase At4g16230-like n=1 Tax=Mercurialis annua TaxID=3986 RepID=UPI0021606916|nr:GDSL esterase/lipase At4g16230-like [Mercurialis annua]